MVGYIQPNGNATVQTTVTVPLSQSPLQLILPTITSVISLIVNSPLVSTQNKTAVNQALSELRSETFWCPESYSSYRPTLKHSVWRSD